jgi:hypothetical protein
MSVRRRAGLVLAVALGLLGVAQPVAASRFGLLSSWSTEGPVTTGFSFAHDIAVGPDSTVYVATTEIQAFSANGTFLRRFGDLPQRADLAVDATGSVYVLNQATNSVEKYDPNGRLVDGHWASTPAGNVATSRSGGIFTHHSEIDSFTPDGQLLGSYPVIPGSGPFAVDERGNAYVPNTGFDTGRAGIWVYSPDGKIIHRIGSAQAGDGDGQFADSGAQGLAIGDAGDLWVADPLNHRIEHFSPTGRFLFSCRSGGGIFGPEDVALSPAGDVYVAAGTRVMRFGSIPKGAKPCELTPPSIDRLTVRPAAFAPAAKPRARRGGALLRFRISEAAMLTLSLTARESHSSLLTISRFRAHAGRNAYRLTGWRHHRRLDAVRYKLTLVATDAAGNKSAPASVAIRIRAR